MALTPAEMRAARGLEGQLDLSLPPVMPGGGKVFDETTAVLEARDGRIERITVFVPYAVRPAVEPLVARKGPRFLVDDGGSFLRITESLTPPAQVD